MLFRSAAGVFYGRQTLTQIRRQCPDSLPVCAIEDWPDFLVRGVMLDVSRDKVPTMATLFALVDELAEWKVNHLELYMEHTFAYRNHRDVWALASPFTAAEIQQLGAYCRERFIELVPNQNSFGHMHRWLDLPRYRQLAECPDGFEWPWGGRGGTFSLNPTDPGSVELLAELYAELLPNFSSRKFNVGCDETFDLGQGRSKAECEKRGKGRVYLDFLKQVYKLTQRHGRTMHFWGDIILHHPELVAELPRDVVVLEWGYEENHPFAEHGALFAKTGIPYYVCPGTSSWCSLSGRTANCLGNLRVAALQGRQHGAVGYLNTDWGDHGHWQYLPVSYLGFAAGAALSWCHDANRDDNFIAALDLHVFHDEAGILGRLAHDLGNAYLQLNKPLGNSTGFFHLFMHGRENPVSREIPADGLRRALDCIDSVMQPLRQARSNRPDAELILAEFAQTARMIRHACRYGLRDDPQALDSDLRDLMGEHNRLWLARNRVGGLIDSARRFEIRLAEHTAAALSHR